MEYRVLGKTGVQVSALCFGTMSFGGDADEATSVAMYQRCREAGINFFDTANVYTGGRSEEILGKLVGPERDQVIVASKVHFPTGSDRNERGLSRRNIMLSVDASLRRLNTDRIDLYYLHGYDPLTPIEEPLRALADLVAQGKILYPGVSNWSAWQIARALGICERHGWPRFECIQPMYNLVKRQAEVEVLPLALAEKMGVASYSPAGGGLLTGKYSKTQRPEHGRLQDNKMYTARYGDPLYFEIAEKFSGVCAGTRRAAGIVGGGLGHVAPRVDGPDHRRAQPGAVGGLAGGCGYRDDPGVASGDQRALARAAATDGSD